MKLCMPDAVSFIIDRLRQNGYSAYAVGGCIRDSLMGLEPHDWDIASCAPAERTKELFSDFRVIETGIKHGTVSVIIDNASYEITTFRVDGKYSDGRRPDSVAFTDSIFEDLRRRDFTVNAMAYDGRTLADPFGGERDLRQGVLRCVGEPDARFCEDALRILRALRFSSVYGFEIEKDTQTSMRKNFRLIKNISPERIFAELQRLLCGKSVYSVLTSFDEIFSFIIPEAAPCTSFKNENGTLWKQICACVALCEPLLELRLAVLFCGLGIPQAAPEHRDCKLAVGGYARESTAIARRTLKRLRSSNKLLETVATLVEYHSAPLETESEIKRVMGLMPSPETILLLYKIKRAIAAAQRNQQVLAQIDKSEALCQKLIADGCCVSLKDLKLNGSDLRSMGVSQGPRLGRLLNALLNEVIDGRLENEYSALRARTQEMLSQLQPPL